MGLRLRNPRKRIFKCKGKWNPAEIFPENLRRGILERNQNNISNNKIIGPGNEESPQGNLLVRGGGGGRGEGIIAKKTSKNCNPHEKHYITTR